jgi:hypothetical protein
MSTTKISNTIFLTDFTRDQHRSLWLSYAVVEKIIENPDQARLLAKRNLKKMRQVHQGQTYKWLYSWERLLDGPVNEIIAMLILQSQLGRDMRQNSPFAGIITDIERKQLLKTWRAQYSRQFS